MNYNDWLDSGDGYTDEEPYQLYNAALFSAPDTYRAPPETRPSGPFHESNLPKPRRFSFANPLDTPDSDASTSLIFDNDRSAPVHASISDAASCCHRRGSFDDGESDSGLEDQQPATPLSNAPSPSDAGHNPRPLAPLPKRVRVVRKLRGRQSVDDDLYHSNNESVQTLSVQPSKRKRPAAPKNKIVKEPRVSPTHTSSSGPSTVVGSSRYSSPKTASKRSSRTRHRKAEPTDPMHCCLIGCDHTIPDLDKSALSEHFSQHSRISRSTTLVRCSFDFCDHKCVVNDMSRHLLGHLPPQYKCPQCKQAMPRKDSRNRHLVNSCERMEGVDAERRLEIIEAAEAEQEWKL